MNGILGLLADAEKLTPDQRAQSVKNGVLPPDLANMLGAEDKSLNQTQPQPTQQPSLADQVMGQADQATDPKNEILEMIDVLKSDIGEIQNAIHTGEVKPYVGIPLLEKKVGELNKLEAMIQPPMQQQLPQQQQMPQGLNEQEQQTQGLNALQSNLPQQMASGGIVNLASGDYIDADDEDDEEEHRLFEQQMMNMPMGEGIGSAIMARADAKKPAMSSFTQPVKDAVAKVINRTPMENKSNVKTSSLPTGGVYDIITEKAKKYNLPPDLMHHIAKAESNYNPKAGNPHGAKGLYQFIDTTWTGMGGKKGEQFDPEINSELGARYIRQNADYLKNRLGRNPTYSEVYGAHFFGPHGAVSLLSKANPDMPIEKGLATFESSKRIKTIMHQNPNLRGKTVGEVFGDLEKKSGQGIVGLAHGGKIKHFDGTDGSDVYDPMGGGIMYGSTTRTPEPIGSRNLYKMINPSYKTPEEVGLEWEKKHGKKKTQLTPDLQAQEDAYKKFDYFKREKPSTFDADKEDADLGDAMKNLQKTEITKEPEKTKSHMDNFLDYLNQSRDDLKKSHETDKYMGLLMAGLGMMGGTSQFAGANIGKGATQGLQHFADLQKQQAVEKANLDKLQMYGVRSQMQNDLYANMRKTPEERKAELDRLLAKDAQEKTQFEKGLEEKAFTNASRYRDQLMNRLKAEGYDPSMMLTWDDKKKAEFQNRLKQIENDPYYLAEMAKSGLPIQQNAGGNSNKIKFDAYGKKVE
jgi:hypothetical protein